MNCRRIRVLVSGQVQGVGFREATRRFAQQQEVTGWVKNLPDGRVEAAIEGEESAVLRMLDFLRSGPPHCFVENVALSEEAPSGGDSQFVVIR